MRTALLGLLMSVPVLGQPADPRGRQEPPGGLAISGNARWALEARQKVLELGTGNRIVIADKYYTVTSDPGVEIIMANGTVEQVLERVMKMIETKEGVPATATLADELEFIDEADAPGVSKYREDVKKLLDSKKVKTDTLPTRRSIPARMSPPVVHARTLVIKTDTRLPYSKVTLTLKHPTWSDEAEAKLRAKIDKARPQPKEENNPFRGR